MGQWGRGRGQRCLWYDNGAVGAGGGDSGAYGTIMGQWGRGRGQRCLWYYKGAVGARSAVLMVR